MARPHHDESEGEEEAADLSPDEVAILEGKEAPAGEDEAMEDAGPPAEEEEEDEEAPGEEARLRGGFASGRDARVGLRPVSSPASLRCRRQPLLLALRELHAAPLRSQAGDLR